MRQTYHVVWSPEGRTIATVQARNKVHACKLAPKPYRRFQGELYAVTPAEYAAMIDPEAAAIAAPLVEIPANACTTCGENFATHNDDGSCVQDSGPSSPETGAASDARGDELCSPSQS